MLWGQADHKAVAAVLCKGFSSCRFVVYHGFHANGDEWLRVIVMRSVEVSES